MSLLRSEKREGCRRHTKLDNGAKESVGGLADERGINVRGVIEHAAVEAKETG